MKKSIIFTFFAAALLLGSCENNNESPALGAKVDVTVTNILGLPVKGTTVYLYKDTKPTLTTKPGDAYAQSVTDDKGVAEFRLNFTQLNILESQTSLYFVVFYIDGEEVSLIANTAAVTVKRNDAKELDIEILW